MDERIVIYKYTGPVQKVSTEKFSMGGYWGVHAVAGLDYYLQAGKFFLEVNYQHWFTDKFNADVPVRFGAAIFF